jgi:hypothetical protein
MTDTKQTRSQIAASDVSALLRARNPLLWVVTREEARVEGYLIEAARSAGYNPLTWDCAQGVTDLKGNRGANIQSPDINTVLDAIRDRARNNSTRTAWIMRDLHKWLEGPIGINTTRQLCNLARLLPGTPTAQAQAIIVLSASNQVPDELVGHATVIDWPLPDRTEIGGMLDAAISVLPEKDAAGAELREAARPKNGEREIAIDAAVGLIGPEAQACFAKSLVQNRRIDPVIIAQEKKRIIAKSGVLEWLDPLKGGLDAVGGLDGMKAWLLKRQLAYSPKARAYGLPAPKGAFVFGISGCGKTMIAKATAAAFKSPLLKLDLGAIKDGLVGRSEQNLRKALGVINAVGRCVVLIDEIEKALAGATQGAADGGVSADALQALLGWMQDRPGEAFVIATANDITSITENSPEVLRKGRFDEVFFVDLPTGEERCAVMQAALAANGRADHKIDVLTVAQACSNFTGSEIAELVPMAMFTAFEQDREIETSDLLAEAKDIVPLSKTASATISKMREWAKDNARPATRPQETADQTVSDARVLDFV